LAGQSTVIGARACEIERQRNEIREMSVSGGGGDAEVHVQMRIAKQ
jgi:hypothetical protein